MVSSGFNYVIHINSFLSAAMALVFGYEIENKYFNWWNKELPEFQ